jgi:hypothetical protein
MVEIRDEAGEPFLERALAQRRSAIDDHPRRLALGV